LRATRSALRIGASGHSTVAMRAERGEGGGGDRQPGDDAGGLREDDAMPALVGGHQRLRRHVAPRAVLLERRLDDATEEGRVGRSKCVLRHDVILASLPAG
jgi:hypothetical protein